MKSATIIQPNGEVHEFTALTQEVPEAEDSICTVQQVSRNALASLLNDEPEFAAVLYDGDAVTLVVGETSALKQLSPNARATGIYWTATIKGLTGVKYEPLTAPMIHGPAILIFEDKRDLRVTP